MLNDTETLPEGATMTPSQVRKLKLAIVIMTVMLVVGFILLLVGIYLQAQKPGKKAKTAASVPAAISPAAPLDTTLTVPPGAEARLRW